MSYTDAQKAAYYKKKAAAASKKVPAKRAYTARAAPAAKRTYVKKKAAPRRPTTNPRSEAYARGAEAVGGTIGAAMGGPPGAILGGVLGRGAHALFKAITGWGDYHIDHNTLMLGGMSPPMIVNSVNKGGVIVRHREYLRDIPASEDFALIALDINPGLQSTFPWLAGVAGSYEEYRMRGLIYEFKSLSSDSVLSSSTSSALGSVIMATSYNSLNPEFINKLQMENYEYANSSKPSCSFIHPIECKPKWTPVSELFVRDSAVPENADQRLYDMGKFQIATTGMQASQGICGELWCTYEIELYKPKFDIDEETLTDLFVLEDVVATAPFGALGSSVLDSRSNLGGTLSASGVSTDLDTYTFPSYVPEGMIFLIQYMLVSEAVAGVVITKPTITLGDALEHKSFYGGTNYSAIAVPNDTETSKRFQYSIFVQVLSNPDPAERSIRFGLAGTIPVSTLSVQNLIITSVTQNFD